MAHKKWNTGMYALHKMSNRIFWKQLALIIAVNGGDVEHLNIVYKIDRESKKSLQF